VGGGDFLTKFKAYLDHLRENIDAVDEPIENAHLMSRAKEGVDSRTVLQWTKTLRDLIELRNSTLANIKLHLMGRDNTFGLVVEPVDHYNSDSMVMFERDFQKFLSPWTQQDLKFKCQGCGLENEEVCQRQFTHPYPQKTEYFHLCPECYKKRRASSPE
jgi:hypothetical protein